MDISILFLGMIPLLFIVILSSRSQFGKRIVTSPNDKKVYRSLCLKNGLGVLLVSDSAATTSAVSMDVNVGQFQDPTECQGLAHYLEHMLFLGNKKYPVAGAFSEFLSSHDGSRNAYTSFENTNFHFSVHKDYLSEALDRFAPFFISSTFSYEFAAREINAVHSEYNKNLKDDSRRVYQVLRSVSNPQHPFSHFGTGNLETLLGRDKTTEQLVQQLKAFYKKYYVAEEMKLVVLGKEPLDQLEKMVKLKFSDIPKGKAPQRSYLNLPVLDVKCPRVIQVKTIKSLRELKLMFPIPSQYLDHLSKPTKLLSHLLGDEGKGSILSVLKQKGYAMGLVAGQRLQTASFSFFDVSISLTVEGLKHVDEMIQTVFEYLELIKGAKHSKLKGYYAEIKNVAGMEFQYQEKTKPIRLVTRLAEDLKYIPPKDVVSASWRYGRYPEDLVKDLLDRLTPENLQVVLMSHQIEHTDQRERWYGTDYKVETVSRERVKAWLPKKEVLELSLPAPNPFILKNTTIKEVFQAVSNIDLIRNEIGGRVWFKQDTVFKHPKASLRILLSNSIGYETPKNAALSHLFTALLLENLNEYAYPATVAGLRFSVSHIVRGLFISIHGYPENIEVILSQIIKEVKAFTIDPQQFERFKDKLKEQKANQGHAPSYRRALYEFYYILSEKLWHFSEYISVLDQLKVEDLKQFVPKLTHRMNIEVLGYGNLLDKEVLHFHQQIKSAFNPKNDAVDVVEERTLKLLKENDQVYELVTCDVNSAVCLYYQAEVKKTWQTVILDLLQVLIEKPFYHQLRTLEQLGYLVWSGYQELNNVEGFYFIIQSAEKDPEHLHSRVEAFVQTFQQQLEKLSDEEFHLIVKTLIDKRLEPPKNLLEQTKIYWKEITSQRYNFHSRDEEVKALKKLEKKDVIRFYKRMFVDQKVRRRLAVHAFPKKHDLKNSSRVVLKDPKSFKHGAQYFNNPSQLNKNERV